KGSAYPSVSNNSQAFFVKPNLIGLIANSHDHQEDHTKLNNLFLFDLNSEKLEFFCPRPQLYNQANWGEQSPNYNMHGTYHAWDNAFYYAFPIDNHLYKFDLIRRQSSVVASVKSEYFEKIKPLSKNTNKVFDKLEVDQHVFTNPAYYNLVYDKYRKIYYRFVLHPLSEAQFFDPQGAPIRAVSIICLDEKFQKLGETFIGNENYFLMYFVGENGLYIANKQKYEQDENYLEFDLFKVSKK
ncbi:MAG: DUF4221 family protein, partial [Rickettsiales bacterium]|nr:DUF4221 family protein [Rickettsiales bacterium]